MTESDKIRSVVARFFNVPEANVSDGFVFPRERLQGSVDRSTFHAALKRIAGVDLPSALTANTYAQLLSAPPEPETSTAGDRPAPISNAQTNGHLAASGGGSAAIGIDIENAEHLPAIQDPWAEPFYAENFVEAEIAYCTRQADPRLSFCGLWSAKEAAIKCGGPFAGLRPKQIEVFHDDRGKPCLRIAGFALREPDFDCDVSISHEARFTVAVCVVRSRPAFPSGPGSEALPGPAEGSTIYRRLIWLNLFLSLLAILLWAFRWMGNK